MTLEVENEIRTEKVSDAAEENKQKTEKAEKVKKKKSDEPLLPSGEKTKFYLCLSFLLPIILMTIGFIAKGVYPFGDQQILVTDLWHQYYPFFKVLHEKLRSGASLFYTWRSGMGTNFVALLAYYGASPLNLLSVLVPETYLREALAVILVLKIGFAGLFCGIFLKKTFGKNDLSVPVFSLLYALCSYILGYYWCVIWMDTVALLPLVILGVEEIIKEKKFLLYSVSLALCLITNYYIALFICIFTVISFFVANIYLRSNIKNFLRSAVYMIVFTILGAGAATFINIPTFKALQLTHSVDNSFPKMTEWYENFVNIIANMNGFHEPTAVDGLPNVYTGTLCIVMLGIFLFSLKIRIREKIGNILVLAFLIVSFNLNKLNYLWHGMHFTNQIPYRFAFLFSFVLVVTAYRAYTIIADGKIKVMDVIGSVVIGGIFFSMSLSKYSTQTKKSVGLTALFFVIYLVFIFIRERGWLNLEMMNIVIALACIVEMSFSVKFGIEAVRTTVRTGYPADNIAVSADLEKIRLEDKELGYREELSTWYSLNDPCLYGYNGVSQFSSMANENISEFCRSLGLPASGGGNRYYYASTAPLTNIFTNVKYMMAKDQYNADDMSFETVPTTTTASIYKNKYYVSLGFMVNPEVIDYNPKDYTNPFEAQNQWFKDTTGLNDELFTKIDVKDVGHSGMYVTKNFYGNYSYTQDDSLIKSNYSEQYYLKYNYAVEKKGMVYAYVDLTGEKDNCVTMKDGVDLHSYNISKQPYIFPMGEFNDGETASLRIPLTKDENSDTITGTATVYVYEINKKALKKAYNFYKESPLTVTKMTDTNISGEVDAKQDGILYMSVPYEKGWSLKVDGKNAEVSKAANAMIAISLTAGKHVIELSYIPDGFVQGMSITLVSVILLAVLFIIQKKKEKKKTSLLTYPWLFTTDIPKNRKLKDQFIVEVQTEDSDKEVEEETDVDVNAAAENDENSEKSEDVKISESESLIEKQTEKVSDEVKDTPQAEKSSDTAGQEENNA